MPQSSAIHTIEEVQRVSQEYASYSQSKNGLGTVLGGIIGLAIYLLNGLLGPSLLTTVLTLSSTLLWFVGKELIRKRLYRPFGDVQEIWSERNRRFHLYNVGFIALVAIGIWIFYAVIGALADPESWPYLAFVALLPFIAWRFLRNHNEFPVGIFLIAACAVTSGGGAYNFLIVFWVPICSVLMIIVGLREHFHFYRLIARFHALQAEE